MMPDRVPLPPWIYPPDDYTPFQQASPVQNFSASSTLDRFLLFRTSPARWTRIAYVTIFKSDLPANSAQFRINYSGGPTGAYGLGVNDFYGSVPIYLVVEPGAEVEVLMMGQGGQPGQIILTGWEFVP